MTRIVTSLAEVAGGYDAAFVDLWGCVHDGVRASPAAVAALRGFRAGGGRVVLVTNAPRAWRVIRDQLPRLQVPDDAWDAIATSGDAARMAMFEGAVGRRVHVMGGAHDLDFFEPPRVLENPVALERVPLAEAEGIVCLGPPDPHADPGVHEADFREAVARGLRLLCANPDIVVDRGERREWCAGALARLYERLGGTSLYFGKPHAPIYELAWRRLRALGVDEARVIAVGDGVATDVAGARGAGLDCLFVAGGLAARETGTAPGGLPDQGRLDALLAAEGEAPRFATGFLS